LRASDAFSSVTVQSTIGIEILTRVLRNQFPDIERSANASRKIIRALRNEQEE
jgi:hypothetical protein